MNSYNLWIDFETTGLDTKKCGILSVALLVEDQRTKEIKEEMEFKIRPFEGALIQEKALQVNGTTLEEALNHEYSEEEAMNVMLNTIQGYISKVKKASSFTIGAYNAAFDVGFLESWCRRTNVKFFTYFNYHTVDPLALVRILRAEKEYNGTSLRLGTVYKAITGKTLNAHKALEDVRAARESYNALVEYYLVGVRDGLKN